MSIPLRKHHVRAVKRIANESIAYNTFSAVRIDSKSTLLPNFIALAMQRRSSAATQMVFRDIVSSYLTFLARVAVQTRLRITRIEVRMLGECHEIVRMKKEDEGKEKDGSLFGRGTSF